VILSNRSFRVLKDRVYIIVKKNQRDYYYTLSVQCMPLFIEEFSLKDDVHTFISVVVDR